MLPVRRHAIFVIAFALAVAASVVCCGSGGERWEQQVSRIVWVAYSPPSADPGKREEATPEEIRKDLAALRKAGFNGLVTYGSTGVMGRELPALALAQGFEGLIIGVWDPSSVEEVSAARAAAKSPLVLGYCVGNEGLGRRYQLPALSAVIRDLREATGKPVTTTEIVEKYSDESVLRLGDWVFPNAHPYFHSQLEPEAAVRWTESAYEDLGKRSGRFILFKEVGLPTAGDSQGRLSEAAQEQYYSALRRTGVRFVYFEAFDQPWKTELPVEPHWGLFNADRTPKRLALRLMAERSTPDGATEPPPAQTAATRTESSAPAAAATAPARPPFYVYEDADSPGNHYKPTGYMGDTGDIHVNEAFRDNPHAGATCIRVVYEAKGKGPSQCPYGPPCKWAGVYWQNPPNNWGTEAFLKGKGFDLSGYDRLVFWARAEKACTVEFKVGGIAQPYGDSLTYPLSKIAELDKDWREFTLDLRGASLKHIIGGFCWTSNWDMSPGGATFYLDDIRFEAR